MILQRKTEGLKLANDQLQHQIRDRLMQLTRLVHRHSKADLGQKLFELSSVRLELRHEVVQVDDGGSGAGVGEVERGQSEVCEWGWGWGWGGGGGGR
jgi:hypothetical protein